MNIFIDAATGTFGIADELYVLYVNEQADIGDLLDSMTDEDRTRLAKAFGSLAIERC